MRILVPGGNGQLGRELTALSSAHQIVPADLPDIDITDPASVAGWLDRESVDAVINVAAYTKVDAAETDADTAHRVNVIGPRVLAGECARRGILLTHISTDFVFDGTATAPIDEWVKPNPLSVYGRTKYLGEEEVRHLAPRHQVVRTSWLYGQAGPNFALTMLRLAREKGALRVVADQYGLPTWTGHLAPALLALLETGVCGTFHLASGGDPASWHGFAAAVVKQAGLDIEVTPITTADYPTPATRPAYSVLDCRAARLLGLAPLPDWRDGVAEYVSSL